MKNLDLLQLEKIEGGGTVSDTIAGACVSIGFLGAIGAIIITGGAAIAIGAACVVNGYGGYKGWW